MKRKPVIRMMERLWRVLAVVVLCAAPCAAGQGGATKTDSWSGVLVTSACNADEAFMESAECFKAVPGAEMALYDDTNRLMYSLAPQDKVKGRLGDTVTVRGTLQEDTIQVASCGPMTIGLEVGQKAPDFSLRDEFGQTQTLETLKGANGTVLLFFRSADW
jgi:AhpC/TSA family